MKQRRHGRKKKGGYSGDGEEYQGKRGEEKLRGRLKMIKIDYMPPQNIYLLHNKRIQ